MRLRFRVPACPCATTHTGRDGTLGLGLMCVFRECEPAASSLGSTVSSTTVTPWSNISCHILGVTRMVRSDDGRRRRATRRGMVVCWAA